MSLSEGVPLNEGEKKEHPLF